MCTFYYIFFCQIKLQGDFRETINYVQFNKTNSVIIMRAEDWIKISAACDENIDIHKVEINPPS